MKNVFGIAAAATLIAMAAFTLIAGAQTTSVSGTSNTAPAAQVIGTNNDVRLTQGLSALGSTLNELSVRENTNPPANQVAIDQSLTAIRGSLLRISGTMAALGSRNSNIAQVNTGASVGTPGLPNTGGGGARFGE